MTEEQFRLATRLAQDISRTEMDLMEAEAAMAQIAAYSGVRVFGQAVVSLTLDNSLFSPAETMATYIDRLQARLEQQKDELNKILQS